MASDNKTGLAAALADQEERRTRAVAGQRAVPEPGPTKSLVRIEATPINPSDLGLLLGAGRHGDRQGLGHRRRGR